MRIGGAANGKGVDKSRTRGYGDSKMKRTVTTRMRSKMSWGNYEKAMETAKKCKFYTTAGGRSEKEIQEAENLRW